LLDLLPAKAPVDVTTTAIAARPAAARTTASRRGIRLVLLR